MGTYRIVPISLLTNEWETVVGTPLTAVTGQSGGGTNLIKTPLASADYRLRGSFIGAAAYYLDGSGTPIDFTALPAGFTPTSAQVNISYSRNGDNSSHIYPQFGTLTEGAAETSPYAYPGTVPSSVLLYAAGVGARGSGTATSSVLMSDGILGVPAMYISGSYSIVSKSWYYNPTTNHYEYVAADPGAPWVAVTAPVPTITSIERDSVYTDDDGSVPVTPARGCAETLLTIRGSGFGDDALVLFDDVLAALASITIVDQTTITVLTPEHVDGAVDVKVINPDGVYDVEIDGFTYTTPWWYKCGTEDVDGLEITYAYFINECEAPVDGDEWTLTTDPEAGVIDTCGDDGAGYRTAYGWYVSPSAYTGDVLVITTNPGQPREWSKLSWAVSGDANMLGGFPGSACVSQNRFLYAANDYVQGTDYPPLRVFDGLFDREVCRLPPTTGDSIPKAIIAMLAANGTVYFTSHDSGSSASDYVGRVFSFDLISGIVRPLGAAFGTGELPYALCWYNGRLWCGTNKTNGTAGKIYYFRPGIDTAWTTDYSLSSSSVGGCTSLCSYNGLLYVGTDNVALSRGKVLVRDAFGAYTVSDTGSAGTAAHVNNGYHSMCVFGTNLYAGYWNNDSTAASVIRKFNGGSWSTVYTGASSTIRPFINLFVDNGVLYAVGSRHSLSGAVLTSANGTSWTDRTANLPGTVRSLVPAVGTLIF